VRHRTKLFDSGIPKDDPRAVKLKCGHSVKGHPLAIIGDRRLWLCPEGCEGLQPNAHYRNR
jgi:hypothetical protein